MKFCNLSEKRLLVLKLKPILDLEFMLKGSKTTKITKRSKNRAWCKSGTRTWRPGTSAPWDPRYGTFLKV